MNPNMRIHKDLIVESHQDLQGEQKQTLRLNQASREMSNTELAVRCEGEIRNFHLGMPSAEESSLELLHRAVARGNKEAREYIQRCFSGQVSSWLRLHPKLRVIRKLHNEEYYVAKTFEYFWQAIHSIQCKEFESLACALHFLHSSLNGVILDSQRANIRSKALSLQIPGQAGELHVQDPFEGNDAWDSFKKVIPNGNEQKLAFLLWHCGLKPKEIKQSFPQEFSDEHDINHLRSRMMNQVARNIDLFSW